MRLDPLFADAEDYREFKDRHDQERVRRGDLATYRGTAYLGIDAGSTTFKAALIAEDGSLLWSHYASNKATFWDARSPRLRPCTTNCRAIPKRAIRS